MRDIKFRAWDKRAKQMYQVKNLGLGKESWLRTATNYGKHPETGYNKFYPSEVEIMQYTGLKDKNRVEIYEGDIVRIKSNPMDMTGYIIYDDFDLAFELRDDENESQECLWYQEQELEVIGNIYNNPELLEKGEKNE